MRGNILAVVLLILLFAPRFAASAQEPSPALIHGNRLFFLQNWRLTVLDASDGSVVKTHPDPSFYGGKLFPAGDNIVAGVDAAGLVKTCLFDGASGELFWTAKMRTALVAGDSVVCVEGESVIAVDARIGEEKWRLKLSSYPTMLTLLDNRLIAYSEWGTKGTLAAIDPETGEKLWEEDAGETASKTLACSDKYIFVIWTSGTSFSTGGTVKGIRCWSSDGKEQPPPATVPIDLSVALQELQAKEIKMFGRDWDYRPWRHLQKWRTPIDGESESLGLARDKTLGAWDLRDGGVLIAPASDRVDAWSRDGRPNPAGKGQQISFHDRQVAWSATPGYMNRGQSNPLLWVAEGNDYLIVAGQLGQVECLDRRTGGSRWLYVYPTDDATLGGADCWSPLRKDGTFTTRLQRYKERAAGIGVTGSVPDGDAAPKSFRIVASPDSGQKYEYFNDAGKTYFLASSILFLVLLGALAIDSRLARSKHAVPEFVDSLLNVGKSPHWAIASAILLLLSGFMLFWRYGGYSPASLVLTGLALAITVLYLVWKVLRTGKRAGQTRPRSLSLFPFSLLFFLICLQVACNILGFVAMLLLVAVGPR